MSVISESLPQTEAPATSPLPDQKTMRRAWVSALRSGQFQQGTRKLCQNGAYCCLGVACVVARLAGFPVKVNPNAWDDYIQFDGNTVSLTENIRKVFGLKDSSGVYQGSSLIRHNDTDCMTFSEIADIIEAEPTGLFVN